MSVSDPYNICVQDTTKFTRLQVAALEGQVSRPLTSTKLQKLSIERKSMDSLEKDFIKYTGDAERSTSEVRHDSLTSPHPITSLILSTSSGPARILDNPGRIRGQAHHAGTRRVAVLHQAVEALPPLRH